MPPMKRPAGLAIALRASSTSEAEIVRALLEDAGLYAIIPDKNTPLPIDLRPLDGEFSLTACDVVVRSGDLIKAKEIIEDARAEGELDSDDDESDDDDEGDFDDDAAAGDDDEEEADFDNDE
jgi:hypothetical protein